MGVEVQVGDGTRVGEGQRQHRGAKSVGGGGNGGT